MNTSMRTIVCVLAVASVASFAAGSSVAYAMENAPAKSMQKATDGRPIEVLYITEYVCGAPKMEKKVVADLSQVAFSTSGPPWHIDPGITLSASIPVFRRVVNDIAPDLKGHIFFGMDHDRNLVVYDGPPSEGKIIKRFEALDIEKMKRGLPVHELDRLQKGIRVDSMDDYGSILSTFSEYFLRK